MRTTVACQKLLFPLFSILTTTTAFGKPCTLYAIFHNLINLHKEIVIKKTPFPRFAFYIISFILFFAAVQRFTQGRYLIGIVLVIISAFFFYSRRWEPKKAQILLKISHDRLWTRNRGNKPWPSIILIKFRYEGHNQYYMEIYRSNEVVPDEELNLHGINISIWRLKRILRKYVRVENL
jgi:hypothetical protein